MGNAMITGQTGSAGSSEIAAGQVIVAAANTVGNSIIMPIKNPVKIFTFYLRSVTTMSPQPFIADLVDGTTYTLISSPGTLAIYLKVTATSLEFFRGGTATQTYVIDYLAFP